ncbi:MAG: DUF1844 domain-containing protein [Candidatus Eisenbacteria bacterium]|nr:DUF1844 domain-containing protein [Candidatus Eisenbacteria bacterium]
MEHDSTQAGRAVNDEPLLMALVGNLQVMTYVYLGKLADPAGGDAVRNLPAAKASIDTLQMLRRKTAGNLTEAEARLLDHVIFELQMNYVDESSRPESSASVETPAETEAAPSAPNGDPPEET